MSSPIIRCPMCRETVDATDEALDVHLKKHTDWEKFRYLWGRDRRAALFIGAAVVVAVLVLGAWALAIVIGIAA